MSIGVKVEDGLATWRRWRRNRQAGAIGAFYRNGGNDQLLAGLPVSSATVVLDVGGYEGSWTAEMLVRYGTRSVVFEPVPEFYHLLEDRFRRNDRVRVVPAGLAGSRRRDQIYLARDGSSVFRRQGPTVDVEMVDIESAFSELDVEEVGCMKINVEGGEYELLESMIDQNLAQRARSLLIQFHEIAPECGQRREMIQHRLRATHQCVFDYEFLWERWDLNLA